MLRTLPLLLLVAVAGNADAVRIGDWNIRRDADGVLAAVKTAR
jgi:hypothetical protein